MKKSLLAVAAIGAFASAAQAQSSVTVYGILDVGYIGTNTRNVFASNVKTTTNQIGSSAETSSRLGFKGKEDLGGGMSAFFTSEFALYPTNSTLSADAYGSSTTAGLANRQTFVGLAKKGLGNASVGTQYTPIHEAVGRTDPGQTNNVVGSVIYPVKVNGADLTTTSYTVRTNNSIVAKTENFAGFSGKVFYNVNDSNSTKTNNAIATATGGGVLNTNGWGIGGDYTWKKLYAAAAYQSFKQTTTNGAISTAANNVDNQTYAAVTYDFGILKAYVNYVNRSLQGTNASSLKRSGQQIGVRSFVTPTIEVWASGGMGRITAADTSTTSSLSIGANNATANFTAYQLGANYLLSKRTNLYAIYGSTQQSSSSTLRSEGANQYAVGVRHTF
jgi:predicted porin